MREYRGCIYKETYHHKGRRSSGSSDGNKCSMRRVRGVGMVFDSLHKIEALLPMSGVMEIF